MIYQGIIDDAELTAMAAPRLRFCTIAGSYTTPMQFMRYESSLFNAVFVNMYGMTETCAAYCLTRPEDDIRVRYNTVGRPISGVEAAAWSEEKGILPPGEVGEIITRGFHLKNGYYKLPPEKQAVDADGWLHSGDLGVFDEGGNLRIVGRIKDIIIKGGENIAPSEIESEAVAIPCVKECRIFGFHDRVYGENLAACVTVTPGMVFDEATVRKTLKARVGSYKTPVHFVVYDAFPLNANGKVDQRALHTDLLNRLRRMELKNELNKGVVIMSMSLKNSTYGIGPVTEMMSGYAQVLGFDRRKANRIRLAVEETLTMRINETARDIGDIHLSILCCNGYLRVVCTDAGMTEDADREDIRRTSTAILVRMADDVSMKLLESGQYETRMDFTYNQDFSIEDFLMAHERV